MKPLWIACGFFFIAFTPITLGVHGVPVPQWLGAWSFIVGYPAGLISLIGGMGNCDER